MRMLIVKVRSSLRASRVHTRLVIATGLHLQERVHATMRIIRSGPSVCAILTQIRAQQNPRMVNARRRSRPADSKFAFKTIASGRQNEKGGFLARLDERRRARLKRIERFGGETWEKEKTEVCPPPPFRPVLSMHRRDKETTGLSSGL